MPSLPLEFAEVMSPRGFVHELRITPKTSLRAAHSCVHECVKCEQIWLLEAVSPHSDSNRGPHPYHEPAECLDLRFACVGQQPARSRVQQLIHA
jgi:hypothetical protein